MYQEKIKITSSQCDVFEELKISALFSMFQDNSVKAVETLGFGKKKTLDKGFLWIVGKVFLKINKYPKYLEEITFESYALEMVHYLYPRYYEIKNNKGEVLISIYANWMLIDNKTRKILSPNDTKVIIRKENDLKPTVLFSPIKMEELDKVSERKVYFSDIDINNHLNNEKYIEYMVDLHNSDFYFHNKIKELYIEFRREIKEEEILSLYSYTKDNLQIVQGKNENDVAYQANIFYESCII